MMEQLPAIAMAILGLVAHFAKTMVAIRQAGDVHVSVWDYIRDHPYASILSVCGAIGLVVVLAEANQLTLAAAFFAGYSADSATDMVRSRVAKIYAA